MRCPHCNAPVPSGSNTCMDCGKRFSVLTTASSGGVKQQEVPVQSGTRTLSRRRSAIRLSWREMIATTLIWVVLAVGLLFANEFFGNDVLTLEQKEQITNEDGSWEMIYTYSDGWSYVLYYDAEGVCYQEDQLLDDLMQCRIYNEGDRWVAEDVYEDGDCIGTWHMEYIELDEDDYYQSCEYFVYAGKSGWNDIIYYDADGTVLGEVHIDPDTGEILDAWGTDLPGNDLSLLMGD